jgi:hypothetical protein
VSEIFSHGFSSQLGIYEELTRNYTSASSGPWSAGELTQNCSLEAYL